MTTPRVAVPPQALEAIAFNLCSLHDFDVAFVRENERFATAVITEYVRTLSTTPAPEGGVVRYGVYVASRASAPERPAMWRKLRDHGHPIISTWIDEAGEGESHDLGDLWGRILREVTSAERLVLYAEADDFPLKGAYVEVGMALAAGVPVFVVLPGVTLAPRSLRPLGSWAKHPLVTFCDTVDQAFAALATREEAPAEAGVWADPDDAPAWPDDVFERAEIKIKGTVVREATGTLTSAQPQAREDEKPVAWRMIGHDGSTISLQAKPYHGGFAHMMEADVGCTVQPLYTHPAPDALREAGEALEPFNRAYQAYLAAYANFMPSGATEAEKRFAEGERKDIAEEAAFEVLSKITLEQLCAVNEALAALQAEQKGGA